MKINVTKSFLPPRDEFDKYLDRIWKSGELTNKGPLLLEFENKLSSSLGLKNFQFVANGTLALQLAISGLGITEGEIITTPFSYVATTSAIMWQGLEPVFVDIDPDTLNIDYKKIEASITAKTRAILAVHVFGNVCEVEKIEAIAKEYGLFVIYDAAHALGVSYKNRSALSHGDISSVSFHATKLFHTIEGGGIVSKLKSTNVAIDLIKRFGHNGEDHISLGINAKANEFQAAMGLSNLPYLRENIQKRRYISEHYDSLLHESKTRKQVMNQTPDDHNYSYYPIIFDSEEKLVNVLERLARKDIFPRRYFYPSLNTLPYISSHQSCPVSEDISKRIVCLPLYPGLEEGAVDIICDIINR